MTDPTDEKPFLLVVDDNPINLDVLVEMLQEDFRLSVVKSGEKALEFVQKTKPQLILLDIIMPEMDGFEVCRQLKMSPTTQSIPVIFISAANDFESINKGFEAGGVDYLSKPFVPLEVKTRINNHLELSRYRLNQQSS